MKAALEQLRQDITRIRSLMSIYEYLLEQHVALDISDILRGCIVLAVSALDAFIHEVIRVGMVQILRGGRKQTPEYQKQKVTFNQISFSPDYAWFDRIILEQHQEKSYQNPKKISEGIKLISDIDLWAEISKQLNEPADNVNHKLKLIVDRRNQIAHEADIDRGLAAPIRRGIDLLDVKDTVNFIEKLAETIYVILNPQNKSQN